MNCIIELCLVFVILVVVEAWIINQNKYDTEELQLNQWIKNWT